MDPEELERWENTIFSFSCMAMVLVLIGAVMVRWAVKIFKGEED